MIWQSTLYVQSEQFLSKRPLGGGEEQLNAVFSEGREGYMPELNIIGTT
jgi:hypothetical protein